MAQPIAFSLFSRLERCLSLAVVVLLAVSAGAGATTYVVTTTTDIIDEGCDATNCSLRDAIIAVNQNPAPPDVITLPAGTYALTLGGLVITHDLTINGAGSATTIVDGKNQVRVFQAVGGGIAVVSVTVVFNGVTIRNGAGVAQGGGIFSFGSLTLNDCVVTGNQSTDQGGGVFATTVTLTNTTISNNSTGQSGGGGVFADNLTMTGSTISGNRLFGNGGGLYVRSDTTISRSVITNNVSEGLGGGISVTPRSDSSATVSITDTTIGNNTAINGDGGGEGGGLYIGGGAAVTVSGCTVSGNTSDGNGGGIASFDTLNLVNSTVNGNTSSAGGGIFSQGNLTVTSSTVASNSPDGIDNSGSGTATLAKTIIANNKTGCTGATDAITDGGSNLQFPGMTCGPTIPSADPLLAPPANNGGPTQTQALLPGSPAINAAGSCPPPATDQRGVSRPQGSACEIGAFECQAGECGICPIITLSPATLPGATAGITYSQTITAAPAGTYTFSVTAGALPDGLMLTAAGLLSGTPAASGNFTFTITATDTANCKGSQSYTLVVAPPACQAPPAPTLSVTPAAVDFGSKVTLSWTATIAAGQGTYVLRLSIGGSSPSDVATIPATSSTTVTYVFTHTGTPGIYDFQVLAQPACNSNLSSASNHAQVNVSGPCPFAPPVTGLTVTPSSAAPGEAFTLTWNPAASLVSGYDVLLSTDGGQTFGLLGTSATTSFSSTVAGTPGTVLTFAVESSGCIYTQPSNFATLTVTNSATCQAPGAVSGIVIRALGIVPARAPAPTEFIDVSWAPPAGGTPPAGYSVRINGETQVEVPSSTNVFPPRGTDLDPIQVFVAAQACTPAVSGPEVASDPVALFLTPPSASFTVSSNPQAGEAVLFTDTSVPQATSWLWVFDDGPTETSQSPSHTFMAAGPHQVSLVATNSAGSATATMTVTVGAAASSRATPPATPLRIDASDPGRRRVRVNIPGPDAVHLTIRSESAVETVVFIRFVDESGRVLAERRLAIEAGHEAIYDLGAYGPRGPLVIELVSGQMYQAQVSSVGHPGAREIER